MKNKFGFILVKPQLGENIGACARSIKNFGFNKLNIVSPKFSCGNFHATCILLLSFLTIISFLTTTSSSTTALGPSLDALDRCVGFFSLTLLRGSPHCAPGNCYFPPTMCYYSVYYSHSRLSILKVFW